jgi:hypothetical protein
MVTAAIIAGTVVYQVWLHWSSDAFLLALWSLTVFGFYALPTV